MCSCLTQSTLPPLGSTTQPQLVANISIIPSDTRNTMGMKAGELLYAPSPDGDPATASPLLYASNRDDPTTSGDAIAIFETKPSLKLVTQFRTGLKHLRGVSFIGADKKYMIVGGMMGGGIKIYERVSASAGYLKQVAIFPAGTITQPASFIWI